MDKCTKVVNDEGKEMKDADNEMSRRWISAVISTTLLVLLVLQ